MKHVIGLKEFLLIDLGIALVISLGAVYYLRGFLKEGKAKGCTVEYINTDKGTVHTLYELDSKKKLLWFPENTGNLETSPNTGKP